MVFAEIYGVKDSGLEVKENLLDATVFNPNAKRCLKQTLQQCYAINENEKKHHCNQRIMKFEDLLL